MTTTGYTMPCAPVPAPPESSRSSSPLDALLADITDRGGTALNVLQHDLAAMQERFMETLYPKLESAGVDTARKIILTVDEEENITLFNDHPDKERIQSVLETCRDLNVLFHHMAQASLLIKDLRNVRKSIDFSQQAGAGYEDFMECGQYRISLKGGLSHFYFR